MSYVFRFEVEDFPVVWVTSKEFWEKHSSFDDRERGKNFPDPIRCILINVQEACFEWNKNKHNIDTVRKLLVTHGWTELSE
jgi:hypothetical protein